MATHLTEEQLAELQESFAMFDKNSDGLITPGELAVLVSNMNKKCTQAKVQQMIEHMDQDGNGKIDFNEFVNAARNTKKTDKELVKAFREFDQDGNGYITESELHIAMKKLGQTLDMNHIKEMIGTADKDGDGRVNYKEFLRLMTKK